MESSQSKTASTSGFSGWNSRLSSLSKPQKEERDNAKKRDHQECALCWAFAPVAPLCLWSLSCRGCGYIHLLPCHLAQLGSAHGAPAGDGKGPAVFLSRRPWLWSGSPLSSELTPLGSGHFSLPVTVLKQVCKFFGIPSTKERLEFFAF